VKEKSQDNNNILLHKEIDSIKEAMAKVIAKGEVKPL
jgi:hypothetical protein